MGKKGRKNGCPVNIRNWVVSILDVATQQFVRIYGLTSLTRTIEGETEDGSADTDIWAEPYITKRSSSCDLEGDKKVIEATGEVDPGQEMLNEYAEMSGCDSDCTLKFVDPYGHGWIADYVVTSAEESSDDSDNSVTWSLEISNEQAMMVAGLIVAGMADGLQERYPELYEAGQAAVEQFEDAFGNGTDALIALCNSLGIEIPASLADALGDESIWNSASDALNTGMEQITGAVGDFMETAGKADMGRYGSGAEQGTEGAKNSVIASMNTTTDPENFTTAADNAQTTGENIGAGVSDGVSGKETDIATAVQGLVASMNTTFEPTVQSFGNTARMAMTNVSIGIQAMQGNAVLSARNAGNAVVNAMRDSLNGSTGYSLGNDLMRGIISGINSMAGMLSSAARTVVRNAVAAMRKAADAHSPSRETLALGRDMDAGGAIGLSGGMMAAAATQAVKDTIRAMTAQTRLSDPSVGTVMTARANARQTAAETVNSLSDGENREAYASAVGRMIADRLIESGALGGDVVMDGEKVGRKTAPTVSKSIADKAKKTVSGRSAQGVLI